MVAFSMPAGADGRPSGTAYFLVPFAAADAYAAIPNGSVANAREATEQLEWLDAAGRAWIVGSTVDRIVMARRTNDELQQLEVYALPKRAVSASK